MSNTTFALVFVLCVNVILFLAQAAIDDINPGGDFYNCEGSLLSKFDAGNCSGSTHTLADGSPISLLPSAEPIEAGDGGLFTDIFGSIKTFFTDTLGLGYLSDMISAPKRFLSVMGLPDAFAFAIAALWYGITLFLIVSFFWGRDA